MARPETRVPLRERAEALVAGVRLAARNLVYRATAVVLVLLILITAGGLWQIWVTIYKDAQARSATLAYLLAEQTTRTFQAVDLTLAGLEPVYQAAPLPDDAASFEKLLAQRVKELDFIHALSVVDASGRVTQTSGAVSAVVSDVSWRPYFAQFVRDPKMKLLIGEPLFSRPGTLSAIPVMRRLTTNDGGFGGMMVASVEPSYFSDFYRSVDLGRRGSIDLYQDNGSILLASTSDVPASDLTPGLAWAPTFDLAATLGTLRSPSSETNRRLVAFHRAGSYPLVVAVSIDLVDLKLRWWRITGPTLAALCAISLLGIAVAVMVARRLEERRQARRRALTAQKLEALGQMTASVSHDFRNLLAVMTSTIRLVRKRGPEEQILKAAEEAVERGSSLITQLLAFSKRNDLEVRSADINKLLGGLEQVLRYAAGPTVVLRLERTEGLPACKTDQTQFDAALMNLVVNARQAMPAGGTIVIATRAAASNPSGFVEVSVADTGAGIAAGDLKRIFEPFFTTKAEIGTGLGLAQVHGFMRHLGGDTAVESELGVGTRFTLLFPVASDQSDHNHAVRPAA